MLIPHITVKNASLAYSEQIIFSDLTIDLPPGKWIGLLGPSGIGKSSLLRLLAGLTMPHETSRGDIHTQNAIPLSQQIAYMAQTDLLLPWLTVLGNATLGLKLRAQTRTDYSIQLEKARLLLEKIGLGHAVNLYPQQLSGGMRQRVALVRTLMENKPIVLMDEPFSALDAITRYKLQALAVELLKEKTVLFITHDPTEALRLADAIYIMKGRPAIVKPVANLPSTLPSAMLRELTDSTVIELQTLLFQELAQAAGESA